MLKISKGWKPFLDIELKKDYFIELNNFLNNEYAQKKIFPPKEKVFRAFELLDPANIKVVIIGQDPYHNDGQADGLAFSVMKSAKIPKSLINIFKEIRSNYPNFNKDDGNLDNWARQGVFLLNRVLTVEEKKPNIHKDIGWEIFTRAVIKHLNKNRKKIIFLLWGKQAQKMSDIIDEEKHYIIKTSHPSPFSAHISFLGSRQFVQVNNILELDKKDKIDWSK